MKYDYVIFCPYFGKLPDWFQLWLQSCEINKNFKFLVFTNDKTKYQIPANVDIIPMCFSKFVNKFRNILGKNLNIKKYYKLCDFKPMYGYVLKEYLKDAKFWGHCDLDLIFGKLEKFIIPYLKYDKISVLGNFCMYKNDKDINEAFKIRAVNNFDYKDILTNDFHFAFDEIGNYGINSIMKKKKYKIGNFNEVIADIDCTFKGSVLSVYKSGKFYKDFSTKVISIENGAVYVYKKKNGKLLKTEYPYVHFQKRKMIVKFDDKIKSNYVITDTSFEKFDGEFDVLKFDKYAKKNHFMFKWIFFKLRALKNKINRIYKITIIKNKNKNKK